MSAMENSSGLSMPIRVASIRVKGCSAAGEGDLNGVGLMAMRGASGLVTVQGVTPVAWAAPQRRFSAGCCRWLSSSSIFRARSVCQS